MTHEKYMKFVFQFTSRVLLEDDRSSSEERPRALFSTHAESRRQDACKCSGTFFFATKPASGWMFTGVEGLELRNCYQSPSLGQHWRLSQISREFIPRPPSGSRAFLGRVQRPLNYATVAEARGGGTPGPPRHDLPTTSPRPPSLLCAGRETKTSQRSPLPPSQELAVVLMLLVTLQRQLKAPFHRAGAEQNIAL